MSEDLAARYVNGRYVRETDYIAPKRARYAADHSRTTAKSFGSGRLCLQAYSPYPRAKWGHQWRETEQRALSGRIPAIVKELMDAAGNISRLVEEGERQAVLERQRWDEEHEKWRRDDTARRAAKALKDSRDELLVLVQSWAESRRIREFLEEADRLIVGLDDSDKTVIGKRLEHARTLIGGDTAIARLRSWKSPEER